MSGKYLSLLVHFTWSTAHREPWIEPKMREDLYSIIGGIARKRKAKLLAAGAVYDHIHLYTSLPSTISIADFVNATKANSSKWIHDSFTRLRGFAWQEGYGAFSLSASQINRTAKYIQTQKEHHAQESFEDEYIRFLDSNGVEYDPKYVFD